MKELKKLEYGFLTERFLNIINPKDLVLTSGLKDYLMKKGKNI
nr:hypothetical protein [uncultured Blautia sp.]